MGVCAQVVNVRLLTNIGRLWTGSEVWSNAAILTHGDQIAWVGPASELPRSLPGVIQSANHAIGGLFTQSAAMGALPTLRAATDPAAAGGEYYGPGGPGQAKGYPVRVSSNAKSRNQAAQQRLWAESQRLTGVTYPV